VQQRSAVSVAAVEPKAQRAPYPDQVAQCRQQVVRGEPRHRRARAPAPVRAVQLHSAVSAAAVEPKAQPAPYPGQVGQCRQHRELVAQCCEHPDRVARCRRPVLSGEPPHASAPAPLRAVQHRLVVSAAVAEPRAQRSQYAALVAQRCQPVVRSGPLRTRAGASAPVHDSLLIDTL